MLGLLVMDLLLEITSPVAKDSVFVGHQGDVDVEKDPSICRKPFMRNPMAA